jgi:phage virion morphogenesis protein
MASHPGRNHRLSLCVQSPRGSPARSGAAAGKQQAPRAPSGSSKGLAGSAEYEALRSGREEVKSEGETIMPGFADTLTIDQFGERLAGLESRINYKPILEQIRLVLIAATKENFRGAHAPDGKPWEKLKPSTIRSRRKGRRAGTPEPLLDTGILIGSLTASFGTTSVEYGTNVNYAAYQQQGTRTIPPRPFLGITDPMEETIEQIVADQIEKQIGDLL